MAEKNQSAGQSAELGTLQKRVAELEQLVEVISRSKNMWETTFDVISDPVLVINPDFSISRANKALAKACDLDIRQVVGQKCYKVFAGREAPCEKCPVSDTIKSTVPHSSELEPFKNNRQYHVNAYSAHHLFSENDESIVLHYRDITDEKFLHKKLMHSEKMAAVGTLAGGIAHEVNNPLGGILAFVQLVMRQLPDDHSSQEDLKEIEDAALRCKKIVRNLLDFSRQEFQEAMDAVRLDEVVQKTLGMVRLNAKQADVELTLDLKEDLPSIHGDFNKLQQVLLNLVGNALHAMKNCQARKLSLSTFCNPEQSKIFLQVQDSGTGIDKKVLNRIFDPYYTTKGQGEGTGLGLSITYKIIQEHHGKIDVESELNKGTTITISFPAIRNIQETSI
ncbi:MAG: PAS domain-containing protein [Deltaproteobacteria bacterium]|nr:PAS domain-containing protein [Deltaproteobacteria bacterium]